MSSRRILSNSKLAPIQRNAVNPFGSFNSDNINLLTRTVSGGDDIVVKGLDVESADYAELTRSVNLLKQYKTYDDFIANWTGENFIHRADLSPTIGGQLGLFLPDGETYGLSYIESQLIFDDFNYLLSKRSNSIREFEVSFTLHYGSPKNIFVAINDSTCVIDHPTCSQGVPNTYTFKISRNLINDSIDKGIKFKLAAIFDTADQWNVPINNKPNIPSEWTTNLGITDYRTIVGISDISCVLINAKRVETKRATCNGTDNYTPNDIHYVHSLKITPGVAIKDDVMLNIMGKSYADKDTAIYLDLSDNYSWIKGKKFDCGDFNSVGGPQYAYVLNGRYTDLRFDSDAKKECTYDPDGTIEKKGRIKVLLDGSTTCDLMDDFDYDPDDITVTLTSYVEHTDINDELVSVDFKYDGTGGATTGTYGGTNLVFVYDKNGTTITLGRYTVSLTGNSVNAFSVNFPVENLPAILKKSINDNTFSLSDIKAYLSRGPIKVLCSKNYIDEEHPENNKIYFEPKKVKWAYVVLYYAYFKNPKPNISYIGLAREEEVNDPKFREDYLILAKVRFVDTNTIDIISYDERQCQTIPSSNNVNYGDNCKMPEIWDKVPETVTDAIDALRQQIKTLQDKLNLDDVVYFWKAH